MDLSFFTIGLRKNFYICFGLVQVEAKDHVITHFNKSKDSVHHCYALEVTESEFRTIEERSLLAEGYGHEVGSSK